MEMLSRQEWTQTADAAAARKFGEDHSTWFAIRRGFVPGLGLVVLAGLGLGAWWLWHHISLPSMPHAGGGLPVAFWIVLAVAFAGTIALFRSTAAPALFFVKLAVAGIVWLGLAGFAIAVTV